MNLDSIPTYPTSMPQTETICGMTFNVSYFVMARADKDSPWRGRGNPEAGYTTLASAQEFADLLMSRFPGAEYQIKKHLSCFVLVATNKEELHDQKLQHVDQAERGRPSGDGEGSGS